MNQNFLILGDMGSGTKVQYKVANSMIHLLKKYPIKFVCGLGDNIYEDGCSSVDDKKFQTHFEDPYKGISNKIKFYMCLGNHDYGLSYNPLSSKFLKNNSPVQVQYGVLSQKEGKKWYLPSKYYTFSKGNIDFFVLDTNIDVLSQQEIETQRRFMKQTIKQSSKKWRILYGHHTWVSPGGHGNADKHLDEFLTDLCSDKRIHMYMCGHDHLKASITKQINGKPTHLIICGTGGKKYHKEFQLQDVVNAHSELEFYSPNLGVAHIKSSKNNLQITFYTDDNEIEHQQTIR